MDSSKQYGNYVRLSTPTLTPEFIQASKELLQVSIDKCEIKLGPPKWFIKQNLQEYDPETGEMVTFSIVGFKAYEIQGE